MTLRGLAVTAVALATLATPSLASAGEPATLLPDLAVRRPGDLEIQTTLGGRRRLRLTTTSANLGRGVVELDPRKQDCDQDGDLEDDRSAVQRTYLDENGNGIYEPAIDDQVAEQLAGCFVFHATHDHWHFEDFARYRLVDPRGDRVVSTQSKVGFCVVDNYRWRPGIPGIPAKPLLLELRGGCDARALPRLGGRLRRVATGSMAGRHGRRGGSILPRPADRSAQAHPRG